MSNAHACMHIGINRKFNTHNMKQEIFSRLADCSTLMVDVDGASGTEITT